jgi:biopolymer transport protein ExbB/TolQ
VELWAWWLIWGGLVSFALIYLGYIGYDLFGKAMRAVKALEPLAKQIETLASTQQKSVTLAEFEGNLLDEPGPLVAEHARNLRKREAKRQARQRRLIDELIDYQVDESEFKP